MENTNTNKNVYIMSLEGADIYSHMIRGNKIKQRFIGMSPYSLELIELKKEGIKIKTDKKTKKETSLDVINVKFTCKVKSGQDLIKIKQKNIKELQEEEKIIKEEKQLEKIIKYKEKLKNDIKIIQDEMNQIDKIKANELDNKEIEINLNKWDEVKNYIDKNDSSEDLRTKLYRDGFVLTELDKEDNPKKDKKGNIKSIKYVVYSRTSAKSRSGQVLFIKEKLYDKMIKWKRLGLDLENRLDIDYPSLLSYESLVSSSIEDTIEIPVKNILIVQDVKSVFNINCNIVEKNKDTDLLESKLEENYKMSNDLFDGEGLLDSQYFNKINRNNGMILTRQHMFKSMLIHTELQKFYRNYAEANGIDYDTWTVKNMFDEIMYVKDIHCVITPNSLKALKFSHVKGSDKEMWQYWKKKVSEKEGCNFGICKSEKPSKRGYDSKGNILNQTSYQMLNSIAFDLETTKKLSEFEVNYIKQLQNNDDAYIEYLQEQANDINSNKMLVDLYKRNNKIANTQIFKDKRKKDIYNYKNHIKKGKIRLHGDYTTICQNLKEYLYHSIGKLPLQNEDELDLIKWENEMIFKENEIFTTLHEFDKEYSAFRNPHTEQANVLICKNKDSEFVRDYFNLTDNMVYANAINFALNRILSGNDVDSDNMIIFNNEMMLDQARKCYVYSSESKYKVSENKVDKSPNKYKICKEDMAKIDNTLSLSQKFIGRVVNLGQLYMSTYWDMINKDYKGENELNRLLEGINICTILSEISIDMAKRMYDVEIKNQIEHLSKCDILAQKKPNFFKYVSKNNKIKTKPYKCTMDYLFEIINEIKNAEGKESVELINLLIEKDLVKADRKQEDKIFEYVKKMCDEIDHINAIMTGETDDDIEEKNNAVDEVIKYYNYYVQKSTVKEDTMYSILFHMIKNNKSDIATKLMNILYTTQNEVFLNAFVEGEKEEVVEETMEQ